VAATAPGFKKAVHNGVVLNVDQTAVVDLRLEIGQVSEILEITASVPLLHAESAELGDVVEQKRVAQLPLNGRFFVNMVALTTGVIPAAQVGNSNSPTYLGARAGVPGVQANGQRPNSNNYTVDGIYNAETMVTNIVLYPRSMPSRNSRSRPAIRKRSSERTPGPPSTR
jgi:hypothetical protein